MYRLNNPLHTHKHKLDHIVYIQVSLKPFRIVEPRMRQLINTVVPRSLVALGQHQENITKLLAEKDWDKVNTEQINATRTAQVYTLSHILIRSKSLNMEPITYHLLISSNWKIIYELYKN